MVTKGEQPEAAVFGVQWFSVQAEGEVGKLRAESESQTACPAVKKRRRKTA